MFNKLKTLHPGKIVPAILIVVLGGSAVAAGAATGGITPRQPDGIRGVVASVDGNTGAGTCMTSATDTFTLTVAEGRATTTVAVTPTTTYTDSAVTTPTFANVCVGNDVRALGAFSSGTLTATSVEIVSPPQANVQGIVASVGGSSAADLCVTSDTESFTVVGSWSLSITTVDLDRDDHLQRCRRHDAVVHRHLRSQLRQGPWSPLVRHPDGDLGRGSASAPGPGSGHRRLGGRQLRCRHLPEL